MTRLTLRESTGLKQLLTLRLLSLLQRGDERFEAEPAHNSRFETGLDVRRGVLAATDSQNW